MTPVIRALDKEIDDKIHEMGKPTLKDIKITDRAKKIAQQSMIFLLLFLIFTRLLCI